MFMVLTETVLGAVVDYFFFFFFFFFKVIVFKLTVSKNGSGRVPTSLKVLEYTGLSWKVLEN